MGSSFNHAPQEDAEDPVFVIPRHIHFTAQQMSRMIEAGQQPGVPFRVGGLGTQRPSRAQKRLCIANSVVSLRRESLSLNATKDGRFGISFSYDSNFDTEAYICIGARDEPSPNEIRVSGCTVVWGPFPLPAAQRGTVDSLTVSDEPLSFELRSLPSVTRSQASGSKLNSNNFDVIILLGDGIQKSDVSSTRNKTNDSAKSKNRSATVYIIPDAHIPPYRGSNKTSIRLPADDLPRGTAVKIHRQVTYFRIRHNDSNSSSTRVQCSAVLQKVMFKSDVYVVQELYGLDKDVSSPPTTPENGATEDVEEIRDQEANEATQNNATSLDGGSECCICLTDPREVAVYPCRHMCMCSVWRICVISTFDKLQSCAEALPSQANKCPICRRTAVMLIRLRSGAVNGEVGVASDAVDDTIDDQVVLTNGSSVARNGKAVQPFEVEDSRNI